MLRVKRLAAAMDMIAAGTSAPMAMAAKPKPTNQSGKTFRNRPGTANCAPKVLSGFTPVATAMKPNRAIRPSRNEYAGNSAALRLMTRPLFDASTPVMECGYMNNASAEPRASVANAVYTFGERKSFADGIFENIVE